MNLAEKTEQQPQSTTSEILFEEGIIGVPRARRFQLLEKKGSPVMVLKSLDINGFMLPVVDPALVDPDYIKSVTASIRHPLEFESDDPALLLLVATLEESGPVANLRAPVIMNVKTMRAAQVILDDQSWPLRKKLEVTKVT